MGPSLLVVDGMAGEGEADGGDKMALHGAGRHGPGPSHSQVIGCAAPEDADVDECLCASQMQ